MIWRKLRKSFHLGNPLYLLWGGFLMLIVLGTIVLWLLGWRNISPIDALFTSTSAVCVTGLIVKSTPNDFHFFSQLWLLILIQIGGVGIMTLGTIVITSLGRRTTFNVRDVTLQTLGDVKPHQMRGMLYDVMRLTLWCEGIGALILFIRFMFLAEMTWHMALWYAIFHSISAFCNAGFSLFTLHGQDSSLMAFTNDPVVGFVIGLQIILGGIGFLVAHDLFEKFRMWKKKRRYRLTFHSRLVLTTTLALIVIGAVLTYAFEYNNPETLQPYSWYGKIIPAFFQSITTRTAGFNSMDISRMTVSTLFISMALMFIGASPGSCGGGVKTTTFATVFLVAWARFRGKRNPQAFNREISDDAVSRAMTLLGLVGALILLATLLLMSVQEWGRPYTDSHGFLAYLFEVVSAAGTVGLSMGISGPNCDLNAAGKLILIVMMYVGRVGPLVIFSRMASPVTRDLIRYPVETPVIG